MVSRLVPLNNWRNSTRVIGKVVISDFSKDVTSASSDAQMCGRHSGSEAAMYFMFQHENSDPKFLVDAANAFNNLNRNYFYRTLSSFFQISQHM